MNNMHLDLVLRSRDFRWFWIMYVTGFNQHYHCQACLKGKKSSRLRYNQSAVSLPMRWSFDLDEFPSPFIYICGVTSHYSKNFHLALTQNPDTTYQFEDTRLSILVTNSIRLPITPVDVDLPKSYTSCRVFQFGYRYFHLQPFSPNQEKW